MLHVHSPGGSTSAQNDSIPVILKELRQIENMNVIRCIFI